MQLFLLKQKQKKSLLCNQLHYCTDSVVLLLLYFKE